MQVNTRDINTTRDSFSDCRTNGVELPKTSPKSVIVLKKRLNCPKVRNCGTYCGTGTAQLMSPLALCAAGNSGVQVHQGCCHPPPRAHSCHLSTAWWGHHSGKAAQGPHGEGHQGGHPLQISWWAHCFPSAAIRKVYHRWASGNQNHHIGLLRVCITIGVFVLSWTVLYNHNLT